MKIGKISPTIWNRSVKKKVHMDQTDGSFSWADVCVCGGHAGIGYYAVLGAAGELAARKIQAEGISVRILFPEETEEEFLADVCGEIQKGCECIKAKLTSLSAEGTAAVQTPIVYACAGGTKVQDPGMHALEETADKKTGNRQKFVKNRELLLCGYAGLEGSLRILEAAEEELSQRFINTFLMQAKKLRDQLITPEQILEAAKGRDISVWQIGSGGILAALWEMAEEEKIGFEIAMGSISLKQETVEMNQILAFLPFWNTLKFLPCPLVFWIFQVRAERIYRACHLVHICSTIRSYPVALAWTSSIKTGRQIASCVVTWRFKIAEPPPINTVGTARRSNPDSVTADSILSIYFRPFSCMIRLASSAILQDSPRSTRSI